MAPRAQIIDMSWNVMSLCSFHSEIFSQSDSDPFKPVQFVRKQRLRGKIGK